MSEILQTYESVVDEGERRVEDVGKQIFRLVHDSDTRASLRLRGIRGAITRNEESIEQCIDNIYTMAESREKAFFIGKESNPEEIVGVGTIIGGIVLRELEHSFIPPRIARKSTKLHRVVRQAYEGRDITAWTKPGYKVELARAYDELVYVANATALEKKNEEGVVVGKYNDWTIEPVEGELAGIHSILYDAGFEQDCGRGYFDDGELKYEPPSVSLCYTLNNNI